ncbi:MAG: hypothetical protein GEU94_13540 [Micromonosporaceae bacterium]|nr:hypothetical protein [Micromonosporaceae bacterium]
MTMSLPTRQAADGGLAAEHWHGHYTPQEVAEIVAATTTTTVVSGQVPLHVRVYRQTFDAPTVVMAHGLVVYGQLLARLQLPFYRAGFNVVQFDLPGLGQSGGARAGCTTAEGIQAWRDTLAFAAEEFGTPLYVMGVGEDGVTGYYAAANQPGVAAISTHTLYEHGEPDGVAWFGPKWLIRLAAWCLAIGATVAPTASIRASRLVSYRDIFGGPGDDEHIARLAGDPLALGRAQLRMAYSLIRRQRPPVPFEQCRTPIQVIASTANRIWPFEVVRRGYERLGGPKELVRLEGRPQWSFDRDFQELYAGHVIRWFCAHRAANPVRSTS